MSANRKRRTFSDAGSINFTIDAPKPSPIIDSQKRKRRASNRQARLLLFPGICSQPSMIPINQASITPPPYFTPGAIYFTLPPHRPDLVFNFWLERQEFQTVTLFSPSKPKDFQFRLNNTTFAIPAGHELHSDGIVINHGLINGKNFIYFNTFNENQTLFVELRLGSNNNIDEMLQFILTNKCISSPSQYSGLETNSCPITGKPIEFPGRGEACFHYQCFDLRAYLTLSVEKNEWLCPICGNKVDFHSIVYDQFYNSRNTVPPPTQNISEDPPPTSSDNSLFQDFVDPINFDESFDSCLLYPKFQSDF